MKCAFSWKVTMLSLAVAALMWTGTAGAEEQFQTLAGIPAAVMSQSELAAVEGKVLGLLGGGLGGLPLLGSLTDVLNLLSILTPGGGGGLGGVFGILNLGGGGGGLGGVLGILSILNLGGGGFI